MMKPKGQPIAVIVEDMPVVDDSPDIYDLPIDPSAPVLSDFLSDTLNQRWVIVQS